jgi:hypothetical protein
MAPTDEALLSTASERSWQEIVPENLPACRDVFLDALERICRSPDFRTSPRSCEFLRHVVIRSLDGDIASLKERLIGMELLGREASYDTSSDAGVRVRANDVRKRLLRYHAAAGKDAEHALMLPSGSYVPQFLRAVEPPEPEPPHAALPQQPAPQQQALQPTPPPAAERLTLYQLALPMLVAAFLCIVCMRWQMAQEQSFDRFWTHFLGASSAVLYLPPLTANGSRDAVSLQELDEAAPLLDLAGAFHRPLHVDSSSGSQIPRDDNVFSLGVNVAPRLSDDLNPAARNRNQSLLRFSVLHTTGGAVILDRKAETGQPPLAHAALLTIDSGERVLVSISGTDDASVRALVRRLCSARTFPSALAGSFRRGLVTQALFYDFPHSKAVIVRAQRGDLRASVEPIP